VDVFIIGITGGVGALLARELRGRGDTVSGLVRTTGQQQELAGQGITTRVGDLTRLSGPGLADLLGPADAVIFGAGAGGGGPAATTAIDGGGVVTAIAAAQQAAVPRFLLVSVFPEAWRERNPGPDFDHYVAVKKGAEIALTRSDLDWVVVRPSALQDEPGRGTVALSVAEVHDTVSRQDVATTLAEVLHERALHRQILELTAGPTPIAEAVAATVR